MPGLKDVDDRPLIAVMRSVNRRILNGWFRATFVGAPVLTIGAAVAAFLTDNADQRVATGGAALLSLLAIGITAVVNVPLNNMLDAASDTPSVADASKVRRRFERRWTLGTLRVQGPRRQR